VTDGTKYVIGRKLGQGGMAETFEATRTHANNHGFRVALKQVLPELLGRSKDKEKEFLQRFSPLVAQALVRQRDGAVDEKIISGQVGAGVQLLYRKGIELESKPLQQAPPAL